MSFRGKAHRLPADKFRVYHLPKKKVSGPLQKELSWVILRFYKKEYTLSTKTTSENLGVDVFFEISKSGLFSIPPPKDQQYLLLLIWERAYQIRIKSRVKSGPLR